MESNVVDSFVVRNFTNYILKPAHTYVQEEYLNEEGKINFEKVSPVRFEFQDAQYLSTGKVIGKCWDIGKDFADKR